MLRGVLSAVVASCSFGLIPLLTLPLTAKGMPTASVLFWRFFIASVLMGFGLLTCGKKIRVPLADMRGLSLMGFFYAMSASSFFYAFEYMDSGVVASIQYCYPVLVVVAMACFFHEKLRASTTIAAAVCALGVALLSLNGGGEVNMYGLGLTLLCATQTALYVICMQVLRLHTRDGLVLTMYFLSVGASILGLIAFVRGELLLPQDMWEWAILLLSGTVTGVISNVALLDSVQRLGSSRAAIFGGLEPVTAMGIGILVFHEVFTLQKLAGVCCIVGAVLLVVLMARRSVEECRAHSISKATVLKNTH